MTENISDRVEILEVRADSSEARMSAVEARLNVIEKNGARHTKALEVLQASVDILKVGVDAILGTIKMLGAGK